MSNLASTAESTGEDDIEVLDNSYGNENENIFDNLRIKIELQSNETFSKENDSIEPCNSKIIKRSSLHRGGSVKEKKYEDEKEIKRNLFQRSVSSCDREEMDTLSNSIIEVQYIDGKLFESKVAYQREISLIRKKISKMFRSNQNAIEKAKPYYIAKDLELQMAVECRQASLEAEQAQFYFEDAKENEKAAETMLHCAKNQQINYDGILENWNVATEKVLKASQKRADAENTFRRKEEQFSSALRSADIIYNEVKSSALKSWPYYSYKDSCSKKLEELRNDIQKYSNKLEEAKKHYKEIFDQINLANTEMEQKPYITNFNLHDELPNSLQKLSRYDELSDIDSVIACFETIHNEMNTCSRGSTFDDGDNLCTSIGDDEEGDTDLQASTPLCKIDSLDNRCIDEDENFEIEVFNSSNEEIAPENELNETFENKPLPFLD